MMWKQWLEGAASTLDLFGVIDHNPRGYGRDTGESAAERDQRALAEDWKQVGNDLWRAMGYRPPRR